MNENAEKKNLESFPDSETMKKINLLTRKELSPKEVYVFNITLCDNEIDRDFEVFSESSLEELGKLFTGKTGISDHSMRSSDQTARIYQTWIERIPGRKTSYGAPYVALKASAYMVRTDKNEDLIKEIDAGIKKEVSIGCSISKNICSICGTDIANGRCEHVRGKKYSGKTCYIVLSEPTDAYEWSFVAVPAQKEAGVTKSYKTESGEEKTQNIKDIVQLAYSGAALTQNQGSRLLEYIEQLEKSAAEAKTYKSDLIKEVEALALITLPEIPSGTFSAVCSGMTVGELKAFRAGLGKKKRAMLPAMPQLSANSAVSAYSNSEYKI